MDALTLLRHDHREVSALLDQAVKCEPEDDSLHDLAKQIEEALTVHAAIEEKYFYPLLRKRSEETEETVDVFEAYTEHDLIKQLIALLKSGRQPDEQFKAEVQVLSENVKHHVKEEESTIFAIAREVIDRDEMEELGEKMGRAKQRMLKADAASGSGTNGKAGSRNGGTSPAKKTSSRKSSSKSR